MKTARIVMILAVALQGCGYTAGAILPNNIRTIYVDDFQNSISFDTSESYQFQPGVEIDITNAIINRYVFDGNLRIARPENADAILTGELIDYVKDPVRFADDNENVEKYRLTLIVRMKLVDQRNDEVLFYEPSFTGDTLYFIAGSDATTEDAALTDAIADLAKNVVDRTIEDW